MHAKMIKDASRKLILAGGAALALAAGTLATTAPAEAFGGHGGGFGGGGAMFHGARGGDFGRGAGGHGFAGRGGFHDGGVGYGVAGLGLGLAAGGFLGDAYGSGYAYNGDDGAYGGCLRAVRTPYGDRTVNVCD